MKTFCTSLREYATNAINFKKRNVLHLTKEKLKSYQDAKASDICGKRILEKFANDKNYRKVKDHFNFTGKYRGAAHSICNSKFNVPNEIPVVFQNDSNYDYHFVINN